MVACQDNANGEPEIVAVIVRCHESDFQNGEHYYGAKKWVDANDYESPFVAFDEFDDIGAKIVDCFDWRGATIIDVEGDVVSIPNKTSKG